MNTSQESRRSWRNFFVKRSLQISMTGKIVLVAAIAAALSTGILALAYNAKARTGSFYYMSNDIRQDIELKSILGIVLPGVIAAQVVSILVGVGIGLFSSRKAAVPIYKFEKWLRLLRNGNLTAQMHFREGGPLKDLSIQCNDLSEFYRRTIRQVSELIGGIEAADCTGDDARRRVEEAQCILARFEV